MFEGQSEELEGAQREMHSSKTADLFTLLSPYGGRTKKARDSDP